MDLLATREGDRVSLNEREETEWTIRKPWHMRLDQNRRILGSPQLCVQTGSIQEFCSPRSYLQSRLSGLKVCPISLMLDCLLKRLQRTFPYACLLVVLVRTKKSYKYPRPSGPLSSA